MRFETILISVVIFLTVLTIGMNIYGQQEEKHDIVADKALFEKFINKEASVTSVENDVRDKVTGELEKDETTEDAMFKGGFSGIKEMTTSVAILANITSQVGKEVDIIPIEFTTAFSTILGILAVAFILYMVFRYKPQ